MYRDDLAAAHARITALEGQLHDVGAPVSEVAIAEIEQLRQMNQQLQQELQRVQREHDRTLLSRSSAHDLELAKVREERDRLVARVQVLQQRTVSPRAAPTPTPAPPVAVKPAAGRPTLWEHNRTLPAIKRGEGARVWCPACRAAGDEVELVSKLGRFAKVSELYDSVACPRCLFTGLRRRK